MDYRLFQKNKKKKQQKLGKWDGGFCFPEILRYTLYCSILGWMKDFLIGILLSHDE